MVLIKQTNRKVALEQHFPSTVCLRCGGFFSTKLAPLPAAAGRRWGPFHLQRMLGLEEGCAITPSPHLRVRPPHPEHPPALSHGISVTDSHHRLPDCARLSGGLFPLLVHPVPTWSVPDPSLLPDPCRLKLDLPHSPDHEYLPKSFLDLVFNKLI